jgi:hypothetical protein
MAWETRKGSSNKYYYRSVRVGSRVKKVYLGRGIDAQRTAMSAEDARGQRQAEKLVIEFERQSIREAMEVTSELTSFVKDVFESELISNGYCKTNGGKWRKRRSRRTDCADPVGPKT